MSTTTLVAMVLAAAGVVGAQSASSEVASVKANKSETGVDRIKISKGNLLVENVSLKRCIGMAYGVPDGRDYLLSGPDWLDSERFDIGARFPPDTSEPIVLVMLQSLLADRFNLLFHRESRPFSAYALVVGKGGPKLHPAAEPQGGYRFRALGGHAAGSSISMPAFADRLSRPDFQLDRRVIDATGLTGTFDFSLEWSPGSEHGENSTGPSIFTALQEQLGLRLEPRKIALEVLVIDHVNRIPTAN